MKTKLKRSIVVAILLFSPLLICLAIPMNVDAAGTMTSTTTVTTTATEAETTTLYWTYSDVSTVPVTRTATFMTTTTGMVQVWAITRITEYVMATTGPFPVPVTVVRTVSYPTLVPVTGSSAVTTAYTTQTLTTITSISASTAITTRVSPRTFTLALNIPVIETTTSNPIAVGLAVTALIATAMAIVDLTIISACWKKEKIYGGRDLDKVFSARDRNYVYGAIILTLLTLTLLSLVLWSEWTSLGQTPIGAPS